MHNLITRSIAIIEAGQTAHGAYVACPDYPTYNYCWFRDGTFIAYAMDLWQKHQSTERFYTWVAHTISERSAAIERCIHAATTSKPLVQADLLHTRYRPDGQVSDEEWPNFQLDGFGTLLWGLQRHMQLTGQKQLPSSWQNTARLLVRYLAALWQHPNSDCWEEFSDQIAVSTLATLYAGLRAIAPVFDTHDQDAILAEETATKIKESVLSAGVRNGHLIKQLHGEPIVDASLLWACVPFGEYSLFQPAEPVMQATVARIEQDLIGATGGVHRYRKDTFYGGGEWMLLTALLGEYRAAIGRLEDAQQNLSYVETHANERGYFPEQSSQAPLHPEYIEKWVELWGPVARPLLWSHAAYLSLFAALQRELVNSEHNVSSI
ncbi:MAG TPA: glycoside hydrolase family 15 protein [Ktedonobacteraceae bacterium]|jgi:GH15 family glucan-1,4-alpha-glucosidase